MRNKLMLAALLGVLNIGTARAADNAPVVLELFTSQGCSSCPPADALLKRLSAENNQLLPLSFHVDYWNNLGWKDPYSSPASTDRQRGYASALDGQIYTPELVVNGATAVVGSDDHRVRDAIKVAQRTISLVQVVITTKPDASTLNVAVSGPGTGGQKVVADIWEVTFRPYVQNHVERGENRGRMLDHVNTVTGIKYLGAWQGSSAHYMLNLPDNKDDRVAVLVQMPGYGRVIGVGTR